jgi:hypothetical protein
LQKTYRAVILNQLNVDGSPRREMIKNYKLRIKILIGEDRGVVKYYKISNTQIKNVHLSRQKIPGNIKFGFHMAKVNIYTENFTYLTCQ